MDALSNWTAKLEYLYYDLGSANYATGGYAVTSADQLCWFGDRIGCDEPRLPASNGNIARVGLNYKFGGGRLIANY